MTIGNKYPRRNKQGDEEELKLRLLKGISA